MPGRRVLGDQPERAHAGARARATSPRRAAQRRPRPRDSDLDVAGSGAAAGCAAAMRRSLACARIPATGSACLALDAVAPGRHRRDARPDVRSPAPAAVVDLRGHLTARRAGSVRGSTPRAAESSAGSACAASRPAERSAGRRRAAVRADRHPAARDGASQAPAAVQRSIGRRDARLRSEQRPGRRGAAPWRMRRAAADPSDGAGCPGSAAPHRARRSLADRCADAGTSHGRAPRAATERAAPADWAVASERRKKPPLERRRRCARRDDAAIEHRFRRALPARGAAHDAHAVRTAPGAHRSTGLSRRMSAAPKRPRDRTAPELVAIHRRPRRCATRAFW